MKTKVIQLSALKPYPQNARFNEKTVVELRDSIESFGYLVPVIVDKKNNIVAGDARVKALKEMGQTEVMCVVIDLSPEKLKEFRVLDNKIQELTTWDKDNLQVELRGLENLQEMFPGLSETVEAGEQHVPGNVTEDDFEYQDKQTANSFTEKVESWDNKIAKVQCPGCARKYSVRVSDLGL